MKRFHEKLNWSRTMYERAWRFALTPAVLGIARSFGFNGVIVFLNVAFMMLAAQGLGKDDFGVFAIVFSAAGLCAVLAGFGQQVFLLRAWHEYAAASDMPRLKGALIFALVACLLATFLVGPVYFIAVSQAYGEEIAAMSGLYMAMLALVTITTHLVRTAIGMEMGDGVVGMVAVSLPLIYLVDLLFRGEAAHIETLFALYSAGFAIAIIIHLAIIYRKIKRSFPDLWSASPVFEHTIWFARSLRLWTSSGLEAGNQYLDVILIGRLMNDAAAGAYFVVTRLANINAIAASAMHMFSTRHLPDLYYSKDINGLARMLDTIALVTLAVIGASILGLVGAGYWLLQLFNPLYTEYFPELIILTFATASVALIGPSASVLMFTGHEQKFLSITASVLAVRLMAFLVLVPVFSLNGAVAATICALLVMAVLTRNAACRLAGLDCSVIRLLKLF